MTLRREIEQKMLALSQGNEAREDVSEWALLAMEGDNPELQALDIWRALDRLAGCDLMTAPGEYLHGRNEFQSWHQELARTGELPEPGEGEKKP